MKEHKHVKLQLSDVVIGDINSRAEIGDLSDLMASIKQRGLLQPPGVALRTDGSYHLVFGFRRLNALLKLGYTEATFAVFDDVSEADEKVINLLENLQRKHLTAAEIGLHVQSLKSMGFKIEEIAARLGTKSRNLRNATTAINRVPEKYRPQIIMDTKGKQREPGKIKINDAVAIVAHRRKLGLPGDAPVVDELFKLATTPMFNRKDLNLYVTNFAEKRPIMDGVRRINRLPSPGFISEEDTRKIFVEFIEGDEAICGSMTEFLRLVLRGVIKYSVPVTKT